MIKNKEQLNANGFQLYRQLLESGQVDSDNITDRQYINVAGVGSTVSVVYEQLRNAAEYAQEHLLVQKAIRRFFIRSLFLQSNHYNKSKAKSIAEELVIELTQSNYIQNNTQPIEVIDEIGKIINKNYDNYLRMKGSGVDERSAQNWTLDLLSLGSEKVLIKDALQPICIQFAYHHYQNTLNKESFALTKTERDGYEASLYVAVHRSLFKSDIAIIRYDMMELYKVSDKNIKDYIKFHKNIDSIFNSEMTNRIVRYVNKYGAPLRILNSMIKDRDKISGLLTDNRQFIKAYLVQVQKEYQKAKSSLNRGLVKSIIFLLITKVLIGVAIEVPFDLITIGVVLIAPLTVNLLTPIVYMIILRLGMKMPDEANSKALQTYAENMLYNNQDQIRLYAKPKEKKYSFGFSIAYILMFLTVFGFVSYLLDIIGFNIVQGIIFFIFLAAASFLGFRMSKTVRELEIITEKPSFFMTLRDFLFTPFTFLGKWLSEKYQKINVVALVLDIVIEMPLKTVLRLLRQWTGFLDEKKDQI